MRQRSCVCPATRQCEKQREKRENAHDYGRFAPTVSVPFAYVSLGIDENASALPSSVSVTLNVNVSLTLVLSVPQVTAEPLKRTLPLLVNAPLRSDTAVHCARNAVAGIVEAAPTIVGAVTVMIAPAVGDVRNVREKPYVTGALACAGLRPLSVKTRLPTLVALNALTCADAASLGVLVVTSTTTIATMRASARVIGR